MGDLVTHDVVDGVAHLKLNRPDAANALDLSLARALRSAVEAWSPARQAVLRRW